jgi:hypothetical protein
MVTTRVQALRNETHSGASWQHASQRLPARGSEDRVIARAAPTVDMEGVDHGSTGEEPAPAAPQRIGSEVIERPAAKQDLDLTPAPAGGAQQCLSGALSPPDPG